jgi:hypothetical protein
MRAGKPETMGCWIAIGLEQHRRKEMRRRFYSQVREMDWDYFSDLWGISDVPEKCDSSRARGEALQPTI